MKYLLETKLQTDNSIKVISLNRPEVKNAFHPEMIEEISQIFKNINNDKKIKAVILKAEGLHFCAGADLNWMSQMVKYSFEENIKDSEKLWEMFERLTNIEVPLIGIVQGAVYGGALGLVACCDYVISEEKAQFCFSEVKLGLAPAIISSFVLRKINQAFVRPLMLSADVFNAATAQRIGLVHKLNPTIENWPNEIQSFSTNGFEAMKETKKLLNQLNREISWAEQKKMTTKVISERRVSAEAQERLAKFLAKK